MKKLLTFVLVLCMVMPMCITSFAAETDTYIYLRPENFAPGSWTPMENETGALDGKNLKGRVDRMTKEAVPASAQVEIKNEGVYYVWTRSMDHETVPGTRNFKVAVAEKVMPKKLASHGTSGYRWELAGKVTLTSGKHFVKLLDTSCYYARCDAVLLTSDINFVPSDSNEDLAAQLKKYQADPKSTAVADTTVPTEQGEEAQPPKGYDASGATSDSSGKVIPKTDGKELIVSVDSTNFFTKDHWGTLTRGARQGLYSDGSNRSGIWHPNIQKPVKVKVSFFMVLDTVNKGQNDTEMGFEVYYGDNQVETFTFNAQQATNEGWVEIGTFDFAGTGNEFVRFTKLTPAGMSNCSRISDMKFEAVSGEIVTGESAPAEPTLPSIRRVKEILIPAGGTGYFEGGAWTVEDGNGLNGGKTSVAAAKDSLAVFVPRIGEAKTAKVEIYNVPEKAFGLDLDKNATFTVVHNGKTDKVSFDMSQAKGWYSLGEFDFKGEGEEYVMFKKESGADCIARLAALRFTTDGNGMATSLEEAKNPVEFKVTPLADTSMIFDENKVSDFALKTAFFYPSEAKIISFESKEYSEKGTWLPSGLAGYFDPVMNKNTSSRYSFEPNASATWGTGGIQGDAEVSIYKLVHANSNNKTRVRINHNGKTETFYLDFTTGTAGWVSLGVYDFAGTPDEGVTIDNSETGLTARANAVRFEQCFVAVNTITEQGKEISVSEVNNAYFDVLPKEANKQVTNHETAPELSLVFDYAKDGMRVIYDGSKVNLAKKDFPKGNLALEVPFGKLSVPLSEIEIADSEKFVLEIIKSDSTVSGLAGNAIDFGAYILKGEERVAIFAENKPFEIKVHAPVSDKQTTALVKINQNGTVFTPAFIDNYGAFGEVHGPYVGSTYQEKAAVFQNDIFAMADVKELGTYAIVKGDVKMPDMAGHWAESDVNLMASKGLVSGKGTGYDPEAPVTRAEFATMLLRAVGVAQSTESAGFSDVTDSDWFAPYVNGAKKAGLLEGMPYTTEFGPNTPITRQEMSAMIVNGIKVAGKYKNTLIEADYFLKDFSDKDSIALWAKEFVARATEFEIIKGIEKDGVLTFSPEENSTRAQAAVMLKRFLDVDAYVGPLGEGEWELTFHDEFDGDDLNDDVWDSVNGPHSHIASSRYRENVEVHDGKAYLIGKDEDKGGMHWTTASIWTKNFDQTYGYFEAKYKYPESDSMNYNIAFWLYKSMINVNDTKYYEIDINEGRMPGTVQTAEHWSADNMASRGSKYDYQWMTDDYRDGFHIFSAEWTENEIVFYVDGREIRRHTTTYSNHPMQVYLSTAIMKEATEEELLKDVDGKAMEVEYVRVYQRKK
ncbi:MAG: S-layer homology domain-containing protein [Clostridia bacterium]|nr:S-layer homology domain-containing protein [Clostridia bacterium]